MRTRDALVGFYDANDLACCQCLCSCAICLEDDMSDKAPTLAELQCPECDCGFFETYDDGLTVCLHCGYRMRGAYMGAEINRIEVIGAEGRMFVKYLGDECIAEIKHQDNGKTMKVFLKEKAQ